jgi:uncharacterized protein involved in tolerance to divalent cations
MWQEYYRPFTISSIQKIFSYGMNSTLRNFHPKYLLSEFTDGRHDKNTVISPFRPHHVHVEAIKQIPPLQEKKAETRHKPRISLYRWLGQHHDEEERRVTFKTEERQDKEVVKEVKDAIETTVENLLDPKVSLDETKEYERYSSFLVLLNTGISHIRRH